MRRNLDGTFFRIGKESNVFPIMCFPKNKIKQFIAKVEWQESNIIERKTK